MTGYIGVRCPVCAKKFGTSDDIVVCPACGAPHHRECYFQTGQCAFQEEHITGKEWRPPCEPKAAEPPSGEKACSHCGKASPEDNIFCNHCGWRIENSGQPYVSQPVFSGVHWPGLDRSFFIYGGLREDDVIADGLTAREYAAYVGPSSAYYLPRFKLMGDGRHFSPNLPAILFGFLFYFYRKMYLIGTILAVLFVIGLIPGILYMKEVFPLVVDTWNARAAFESLGLVVGRVEDINENLVRHYDNLSMIVRSINLLIAIATSFLANRFYFERATKSILRVRAARESGEMPDSAEYECALSRSGGVSRGLVALLLAAYMAASVLVYYHFILVP